MLTPGGVGLGRPYTRPRRRGVRLRRMLGALVVLALLAAGGWYFFIREPAPAAQPRAAACTTPTAKPAVARPAFTPQQVTLNVYNATNRKGLAAQTAAALKKRGFVIARIANDPLRKKLTGTAEIRSGPKGRSRVAVVALHVPGARSIVVRRSDLSVDLVLGAQYTALRTPEQITVLLTPPKLPGC